MPKCGYVFTNDTANQFTCGSARRSLDAPLSLHRAYLLAFICVLRHLWGELVGLWPHDPIVLIHCVCRFICLSWKVFGSWPNGPTVGGPNSLVCWEASKLIIDFIGIISVKICVTNFLANGHAPECDKHLSSLSNLRHPVSSEAKDSVATSASSSSSFPVVCWVFLSSGSDDPNRPPSPSSSSLAA